MKAVKLSLLIPAIACIGALLVYYLLNSYNSYGVSSSTASRPQDLTFLVLGRTGAGEGGMWEGAPNLTDAIMLVDLNTRTGVLNLISIPRDLYGTWGSSAFKINEAFERGKMNDLLNGVADITGIGTDKYVVIDLNTVSSIVDALGGVDINLPSRITDEVSGYTLSSGEHHLDGATAVWIMRNRYAGEGDFFREENQHLILEALLEKLRGMSTAERLSFVIKVLPTLSSDESNMNFGDLLNYASEINGIKFNNIVLDFTTGLLESSSTTVGNSEMYILLPISGMNNYSGVRAYIQSKLE